MYQLKKNKNIKHPVVSFFTSLDKKITTSSVKFGSWDQSAIDPSDTLRMIKTINSKSWGLKLKYLSMNWEHLDLPGLSRHIVIEP
jgi:hypothetical protein